MRLGITLRKVFGHTVTIPTGSVVVLTEIEHETTTANAYLIRVHWKGQSITLGEDWKIVIREVKGNEELNLAKVLWA